MNDCALSRQLVAKVMAAADCCHGQAGLVQEDAAHDTGCKLPL